MDEMITRVEHDEFGRRIEERDKRQDKRIELLEESTKRLEALSISIEKLATNMEHMLKEQIQQGERLEALESRDGEMWRKVVSYALTTVVGIAIGFIFNQIGI